MTGNLIFFDTSSWIKCYILECGSTEVQNFILEQSQNRKNKFVASAVTYAEMVATFARALNGRRLTEIEYNMMIVDFKDKWDDFYVPEVDADHIVQSGRCAEKYTLKGCDAFQLASAIASKVNLFVCSDNDLLKAAEAEGFIVWNPMNDEYKL